MRWEDENQTLAALFINNDLRIVDAHETKRGDVLLNLQKLGFDTARINSGYGYALDFVMNKVIAAFEAINNSLGILLRRDSSCAS